jgi:hypothetical protein
VRNQTENFNSTSSDPEMDEITRKKFEQFNNPEFIKNTVRDYNTNHQKDDPGFGFKRILLSVIESNMLNITLLDDDFLWKLLEIKFQVNSLNEEMQRVYDYMKLTFDWSISTDNHFIVSNEIKNSNLFIAKRAILIVDKINLAIK